MIDFKGLLGSLGLLIFALVAQPAIALDDVHLCDEYAAHPDDPFRWSAGVLDDEIIPGAAIHYCTLAVQEYPGVDRFVFQLARAQWAGLQYAEGLENFFALHEKSGYGPTYAYLADAYTYGIGGLEVDEELGLQLYEVAADAGFLPALEVLESLQSGEQQIAIVQEPQVIPSQNTGAEQSELVAVQPQQPQTSQDIAFSTESFFEGKLLKAFNDGNLKAARIGKAPYVNTDKSYYYLVGFLKPFEENYNIRDPNCLKMSNPRLVRVLNTRIAQAVPAAGIFVGNGRSLEANLNSGAEMGFKMMGDLLKGMNSGQGIFGSELGDLTEVTLLTEHGDKDARRLISKYSCGSPVTQRIMANIEVYVSGQGSAILSDEEKARRAQAAEQERERKEEERQEQIRVAAASSCESQFKNNAFCGCVVSGLDKIGIEDADWSTVSKDFRQIVSVGKTYPAIGDTIKSCRSQ